MFKRRMPSRILVRFDALENVRTQGNCLALSFQVGLGPLFGVLRFLSTVGEFGNGHVAPAIKIPAGLDYK